MGLLKGPKAKVRKPSNSKPGNVNNAQYASDPDLLLLRDAAADERNAIALYLEAAMETGLDDLFLDAAEDEMRHYVETMQAISRLDPVQARLLKEEKLTDLTMVRRLNKTKWNGYKVDDDDEVIPSVPSKEDMRSIRYLTRGLSDELHAINKYQRYMLEAEHGFVRDLFGHLMNEEKEHVAEFTAALYNITDEPLPPEDTED